MELKFKVILLGPAAVGKTSLMYRYVNDTFNENYIATLGAQFLSKEITMETRSGDLLSCKLIIWDIIGQSNPHYDDLRTTFYRGSEGAFLVFDLTRKTTLDRLSGWYKQLVKVLNKKIPTILIGNKLDLIENGNDALKIKELAGEFAKEIDCGYKETSAKNGKNVNNIFLELATLLVRRAGYDVKEKKTILSDEEDSNISDTYLIRNRIRDYIKSKGFRISSELLDGKTLDTQILAILDKAIWRAKKNGRITVKSRDI
ncbi:MAG: Small GTP-binding domain protein [Promethearchaeota archaeon]|nr:MAG: Small GTP-binding domain protein [Candidatus Lokiarchaeota archaeon]